MIDLKFSLGVLLIVLVTGCNLDGAGMDGAAHHEDVLRWRTERLRALKEPEGYLNLAGLYWLSKPSSSFGSDAGNDIVFPQKAASLIGQFILTDDGVVMNSESGVDVRFQDYPVRSLLISDDTTDNPVTITHGTLAWNVILRDGRYAVRLRDYEHPAINGFPPLEYFPIDPDWRITAAFMPFEETRVMQVDTVIEGLGWHPESPGTVVFDIDGKLHELEAYASGDELFFVFGDQSNGKTTYPAGRFLYATAPGTDGKTVLDFNRAYSPPCAFNDFSTCPVASPRNRLALVVDAGEKFNPSAHTAPGKRH